MSKSYDNGIGVWLPEKKLRKLIMKITTDSSEPHEPKDPNGNTIMDLYKSFASEEQVDALEKRFKTGIGWGEAKQELFEVVNSYLAEPRGKYNHLMENKNLIDEVLVDGQKRASEIAKKTMKRIRTRMTGF
jgi:tryptophanyl-tRNA synthetase